MAIREGSCCITADWVLAVSETTSKSILNLKRRKDQALSSCWQGWVFQLHIQSEKKEESFGIRSCLKKEEKKSCIINRVNSWTTHKQSGYWRRRRGTLSHPLPLSAGCSAPSRWRTPAASRRRRRGSERGWSACPSWRAPQTSRSEPAGAGRRRNSTETPCEGGGRRQRAREIKSKAGWCGWQDKSESQLLLFFSFFLPPAGLIRAR